MTAYLVGYWGRICNLTVDELRDHDDYGGWDREKLQEGWNDADEELRQEKFTELKQRLAEVEIGEDDWRPSGDSKLLLGSAATMGFKTKAEAESAACKALSLLADDGFRVGEWDSEVWHNLNWCMGLYCGPISVYYSDVYPERPYWCMIAPTVANRGTGCIDWSAESHQSFATPGEAIRHEVAMMREYAERERKRLADLDDFVEKILNEKE